MRRPLILIAFSLSCSLALSQVSWAAKFMGLGDLPGGGVASYSKGISANGRVVVGSSYGAFGGNEAVYWSPSTGIEPIRPNHEGSEAVAASADGKVIVGSTGGPFGAFRWAESTGLQILNSEYATDVSADGSVVVGHFSIGPFERSYRWTESTGLVDIGLPTGASGALAYGVSADGSVIVGTSAIEQGASDSFEAFCWTEAGGFVGLGDLPGGVTQSNAYAISGDGLVVVGESISSFGQQGFRWTENDGMVALDDLEGSKLEALPYAVNHDGSVIVGTVDDGPYLTFIWTESGGVVDLQSYLENEIGLDLTDWTLTNAFGISANGKVITGEGTNPAGNPEAWIAVIPEPESWLMVIGFCAVGIFVVRERRN